MDMQLTIEISRSVASIGLTYQGSSVKWNSNTTFADGQLLLDKDNGISVVSAKDIVIHADGNVSFEAGGKIQMVAQKEIDAQSGQSHVKILNNQIFKSYY